MKDFIDWVANSNHSIFVFLSLVFVIIIIIFTYLLIALIITLNGFGWVSILMAFTPPFIAIERAYTKSRRQD